MKAVNNKSLLAFIFDQMDKLDNKEIDVETAKAQSNLCKQANNALKYELNRAKTKMDLSQHNKLTGDNLELREAETKNFDNTIQ